MATGSGNSSRAATLGDLVFYLRGKDVDLSSSVADGKKKVGKLADAGKKAAKAIGKAFTVAGAIITGVFGLSLRSALSFQEGLKKVETLGVKNIDALSDGLKRFAIESGQDAIAMTEDLYNALSAGIPEDAAIMVLEKAYLGAAAGAGSLSAALEAGTSLMNAYGLNTGDANEIVKNFEEIQGFLAVTIKTGKTNMDELGGAVGKGAAIMSAAGVPMKEYLAMVGALTTTGVAATEAVTQLKAAVIAIIAPSEEAKKAANLLGLEFSATALKEEGSAVAFFRKIAERVKEMNPELIKSLGIIQKTKIELEEERKGLVAKLDALFEIEKRTPAQTKVMNELRISLKKNSAAAKENNAKLTDMKVIGDDAEGTMKKLLSSTEGMAGVLALTGPLAGKVDEALGGMKDAVSTLHEMANKYTDGNLTKTLDEQKRSLQVLGIELGEVLLPILAELLAITKPILAGILKWIEENPKLFATLTKVAAAVGAVMLVVGPFLLALPGLATGIGAIATVLGVSTLALTGWGAAAIATFGIFYVFGTWLNGFIDDKLPWFGKAIDNFFDDLWRNILKVTPVGRALLFLYEKLFGKIGEAPELITKYTDAEIAALRAEAGMASISTSNIALPNNIGSQMASAGTGGSRSSASPGGVAGIHINMGGVNINNGMDANALAVKIANTVQSSMRNRGMNLGTI